MLAMVCNLTLGRPRFAAVQAQATGAVAQLTALRQGLLTLADADADAYGGVRDAFRLPRSTDPEQQARASAIEVAMHAATDVPVQTAEEARAVLALGQEVAEIGNPGVLSDVAVAVHVATAAIRGALAQADFNVASLTDRAFALAMQARIDRLSADLDEAASRILETVASRATS